MRALLIAVLLAACGTSDDGFSDEDLADIAMRTNASRSTCASGEWGTNTDCATVCTPKPAEVERPDGCFSRFIVTVEGARGYCRGVDAVKVDWFPCEGGK